MSTSILAAVAVWVLDFRRVVASFGVFEPTGFCPTNVFFIANVAMNFDITGVVFSGFIGEHMDA
jgi:hypothetical protein